MNGSNIARAKIDISFTLYGRQILEQLDFVTARGFHDCKLDLRTFHSGDFAGHFAFLMRGM